MLYLTVAFNEETDDIANRLKLISDNFVSKGINMGIAESQEGGVHLIKYYCDDEKFNIKHKQMLNLYIANLIYDILMNNFFNNGLNTFLQETYFFLKKDELAEIKRQSINALKCENTVINDDVVFCINRKNRIVEKISGCIEENNEINIEGFIRFRMNDIKEDLEAVIDKVVERYMVEKEYDEFINLLKYFVDIQENKIDEVNVIIKKDGSYILNDKNGNNISEKLTEELSDGGFSGVVSEDDLLISCLVANSPGRIVLHCIENSNNQELIDTIKEVFGMRTVICSGCKQCNPLRSKLKV